MSQPSTLHFSSLRLVLNKTRKKLLRFEQNPTPRTKRKIALIIITFCSLSLAFMLTVFATCPVTPFNFGCQQNEQTHTLMFRPKHIEADNEQCQQQRLQTIDTKTSKNDFIPYQCYNHNNQFLTVIGMHLNPFDTAQLSFFVNGHPLQVVNIHSGMDTFVINVPLKREQLRRSREQLFSYSLAGCFYHMPCPNYVPEQSDEFNLCVYTKRNLSVLTPYLHHYVNFVDRIFIYSTDPASFQTLRPLHAQRRKFRVVPWYLNWLRDPSISPHVYDDLTDRVHNYRKYPRDLQKTQTNDCMYRNRDTDMVLMVDDDEYLNYLNRDFYRSLYKDLVDKKDDVIFLRNFCNTTVQVNAELSDALDKPTTKCDKSRRKRLEKAIVLPKNCALYEIHRCFSNNSYSLSHLNIFATHKPYSPTPK